MALAVASALLTDAQRFIYQTHPLYMEWQPTWKLLSEVYEGNGGFLTGGHLVPHPRELVYPKTADGQLDTSQTPIEKDKFKRRRQLARYENFAQALIDLIVDHQYIKGITRTFGGIKAADTANEPLAQWWEDVDGCGTNIDDWLKETQAIANVFGHVFVVLDRERPDPDQPIVSAADEGRLYLRVYTPLDALDWLAPHRKLTQVKFAEAIERRSLAEASTFAADTTATSLIAGGSTAAAVPQIQYRVWTQRQWAVYNRNGGEQTGGLHGWGELPVIVFYSRPRPKIPILGRSLLRDPRLFKDHYNMVSEFRELLRAQTFSILHVQLGEGEDVSEARSRLGDHAGTDTILWTRGMASFITPESGPATTYMEDIKNIEAKMFRLLGVGADADSHVAETEGSRRIKAMDLNRLLGGLALEAQKFEHKLARLWYVGMYGPELGAQKFQQASLSIIHPTEFYVEELEQTITTTLTSLTLPLGPTFSTLIKQRAVPKILRDIEPEDLDQINTEIEEQVAQEEDARQAGLDAAAAGLTAIAEGAGAADTGTPPAEGAPSPTPEQTDAAATRSVQSRGSTKPKPVPRARPKSTAA